MYKLSNCVVLVAILGSGFWIPDSSSGQTLPQQKRIVPRLEPIAETKLLMEGLNQSNFKGLEKILRQKPADTETWAFARGQALLIAETGNLLMLRPPKNPSEQAWMERAMDLRSSAAQLARAAADRDLERSRSGLIEVGNACNRCHQAFRVPVKITPFADPTERRAEGQGSGVRNQGSGIGD